MRKASHVLLFMCCFGIYCCDSASASVIDRAVPNAAVVGKGRLVKFFFNIYDLTLYAPKGQWAPAAPYALQFHYLRDAKAEKIVQETIRQMRIQNIDDGVLRLWAVKMHDIFPDVRKDMILTVSYDMTGTSIFYVGDKVIGEISDASFTQAFFNIWLDEKTSEPTLRRQLLGVQ